MMPFRHLLLLLVLLAAPAHAWQQPQSLAVEPLAVETADVTGVVQSIGLRKSRLTLEDGDVMVLGNQAIEQRWRRRI